METNGKQEESAPPYDLNLNEDVTVGIVLRAPFRKVADIRRALEALDDVFVVFLRISPGYLWIQRGKPPEANAPPKGGGQ